MNKVPKLKEFTDAEAEAFIRYLTQIPKSKKKTLAKVLSETPYGKSLIEEWVRATRKWEQR